MLCLKYAVLENKYICIVMELDPEQQPVQRYKPLEYDLHNAETGDLNKCK